MKLGTNAPFVQLCVAGRGLVRNPAAGRSRSPTLRAEGRVRREPLCKDAPGARPLTAPPGSLPFPGKAGGADRPPCPRVGAEEAAWRAAGDRGEDRPWRARSSLGLSGSSRHSARPNGSAGCPQTWSSGSGSHRSSPPHSSQTCLGKSHRFQICRQAGGKGRWRAADAFHPRSQGSGAGQGTRPKACPHHLPQPQPPGSQAQELSVRTRWARIGKKTWASSCRRPRGPPPGPAPYCSASLKNW